MPDGDAGIDEGAMIAFAMNDDIVLYVGFSADPDRAVVATQHGAEPDARACGNLDIPYQGGVVSEKDVRRDPGPPAAEFDQCRHVGLPSR